MDYLWFLLISAIVLILLIQMVYAGVSFAPWMPTRKRDIQRALKLANLQPGETYYELGSGSGGVLLRAAEYKGVKAIGFEIFFPLYLLTKIRIKLRNSNAQVFQKDLFKADLSDADVVYLFGTPEGLAKKLEKKLWEECKPGTRIISYTMKFAQHDPAVIDKPNQKELSLFVYKI